MLALTIKHTFFCIQGEIKITAFNNEVDKYFSLVEQGKVSECFATIQQQLFKML